MGKATLSPSLSNPTYHPFSFGEPPYQLPPDLPSSPGIYIFADAAQNPLYIGKSINLRSRIAQHLENGSQKQTKAAHFLPQTKLLILQTVESDLAAIILEANLIKIYQPYYNAAAKDDKTVSYITIGNPPQFTLKVLHHSDLRLTEYDSPDTQIYGPYPTGTIAQIIMRQVRRIFGYCQDPTNREKHACFYFHIRQCPGPCTDAITQNNYKKHITRIKSFLSGRFQTLINSLKKEINKAAKKQDFETAAKLKIQLEALQAAIMSHQYRQLLSLPVATGKVLNQTVVLLKHPKLKETPHRIECYDMATMNQENTVGSMIVFTDGQPDKRQYRKFLVRTSQKGDTHTMKHIMQRRMRHPDWAKPDLIILDGGVPQLSIVSQVIPSDIPVIALSKKRETLHFYDDNQQIVNVNLPLHNNVLKLFQSARDEAHHFATTYHILRRKKITLAG